MSDKGEFQKRIAKVHGRRERATREIVAQVKSLIPVLKDHSLSNAAKALEELFFQLDAADGELQDIFLSLSNDPALLIEILSAKGPPA